MESKEELERLAIDVAIDLGNLKTAFLKVRREKREKGEGTCGSNDQFHGCHKAVS